MVDINLMGDEENREEIQPEESLAQTVNLDLGDYAEEEKTEVFPREPMPGAYSPREPMGNAYPRPSPMSAPASGSSRNMAYLLVAILILLALVAVYLMIPRGANKPQPNVGELAQNDSLSETANRIETPIDTTMMAGGGTPSGAGNLANTTTEPVQPPIASQPPTSTTANTESAPANFPMASSTFASTRIGAYTVGALGQAFGGADFSLISFSGNNNSFLVQFPPSSASSVTDITEAMKRNASPEDIRTVSKGNGTSNALVLGRVSERAAMMGPQGGQQRMSYTAFSTWVKKLAADNGLTTKLFDGSQAYSSGGTTRTPVQANFSGDRTGVFNFLKSLADAGPNIVTSKIIVSPSDRKSQSSAQLDVVLLFDFVE
jgi:HAMP domain-containing protein